MRKLYVLLGLFMVFSLVLGACTATPTAAPVDEPVVAEPTEVVVEEVSLNPYLGSNKLDGNGIPVTFFQDVHIRKAFGYCFDWATVVDEVYMGEAVQAKTLALPGMPGYQADSDFYTLDLEKCAEEFKLADVDMDGIPAGEDTDDVWSVGFRLQMLYNTGNTTRQIMAEILQANLAEVNELFSVEVLGLPWPAYLTAQRAHKIPIMTGGWHEDIHDPHNWYQPYTVGAYGSRQALPEELKAQFKVLLDRGVALTEDAARAEVYYEFNQLYFDLVPGLPVVTATSHAYEQRWVEGRVFNPIFSNIIYYPISKTDAAPDPTTFNMVTIAGGPDTLDPALAYDTASGEVIQNVYETLVTYEGEEPSKFLPKLAESWTVSEDGLVYVFNLKKDVKFHDGADLTASDVAYSFTRGLLQGGYISPQLLLAEPFYGVGNDDITMIVDGGASADDREALLAVDPAVLKEACEKTKAAIVADDAAGTVTMTLATPWGPFLGTIANSWGSILDQDWVIANGGWDGSCDTWQNFYAMTAAENPLSKIMNGTGPFKLDYWTEGQEVSLVRNDEYWQEPAKLERVLIKEVAEFGTRFSMLQAGDADVIVVPPEYRTQVDPLVGEILVYNEDTLTFDAPAPVCGVDTSKLGVERFEICTTPSEQPLRLRLGQPGITLDVILFNFGIE
jgi:ABC-type transport system substrate-binding protein